MYRDATRLMRWWNALALCLALCIALAMPARADALREEDSIYRFCNYGQDHVVAIRYMQQRQYASFYAMEGNRLIREWDYALPEGAHFDAIIALPGLPGSALISAEHVLVVDERGELFDEYVPETPVEWGAGKTSPERCAAMLSDYKQFLIISQSGINLRSAIGTHRMTEELEDVPPKNETIRFIFLGEDGTLYYRGYNGYYWALDADQVWTQFKHDGTLVRVYAEQFCVLSGNRLTGHGNADVRLPEGEYYVDGIAGNGFTLSKVVETITTENGFERAVGDEETFLVSSDGQYGVWKNARLDAYFDKYSDDLRFVLVTADDDQDPPKLIAWSRDKGPWKFGLQHVGKILGDMSFLQDFWVLNDGNVLFLGKADQGNGRQFWKLDLTSGEYAPLSIGSS